MLVINIFKCLDSEEEDMETIYLRDEFIKLGQALKLAGLVSSGVEAKEVIQEKIK